MYQIKITGLSSPADSAMLEAALEIAVADGANWYLREWDAGREPKCCLECGGVVYTPDPPRSGTTIPTPQVVYATQRASCQGAAVATAAHERAAAIRGGMSPAKASQVHRVTLKPQTHPTGAQYFHAYYQGPKGVVDVTEDMPRQ